VSGCSSGVGSIGALCDATEMLRDAHTDALLLDGGHQSIETGAALIAAVDGSCVT
jgi:hypothetical protein